MRFCTVGILLQKASMHLPYILFMCIFLFLIIGMGEPLRIGQTPAAHAPGAQILGGKGQAKRTRMKRKMSEHASSIGSDEQNLDIPKQLQAPESNEPTCGAVAQCASGTCTSSKRLQSSEQCAVPGVSWHSKYRRWQVSWYEEKKRKKKYFHVRHFMKTSRAEADALRAAIEFRTGLERSGTAKAKRVKNFQSGVKGITWHNRRQTWQVQLKINGKLIPGGYFKPKDSTPEEVERARLAAVESRRKLEDKYCTIKQST